MRDLIVRLNVGAKQTGEILCWYPAPYFAAYAASKSYTLALALALREEWRGRIQESGLVVVGMGQRCTAASFVAACNAFVYLDDDATDFVAHQAMLDCLKGMVNA